MSYEQEHLKEKGINIACTDIGNAERFVKQNRETLRYVDSGFKQWTVWDGTRWTFDVPKTFHKAKEAVKAIYDEARDCEHSQGRSELTNWAKRSQSRPSIENMLNLASKELSISIEAFDRDNTKVNCLNGIVNLETGEIEGHSPERLVMKRAEVQYNTDAKRDVFLKFLNDIFLGNQELIDFVQRALGYSITGLQKDHHLFIAYGTGRNGKGTLFDTIRAILGGYARPINIEILLSNEKGNVRILEEVGHLKGNRFSLASEVPTNKRWSEDIIKRLTGANMLKGARLHVGTFDFEPTHHIWIECNHLPAAKDATIGFWSRPIVIPFKAQFTGDAQDKDLPKKLLEEREGIFAWLVKGAMMYLKDGLGKLPQVCKDEAERYRDANDVIGRCIKDAL